MAEVNDNGSIQLFEDQKIRTAWDAEKEEWYFSIIDVISVLIGTANPRRYWSDLKRKLKTEGANELYEKISSPSGILDSPIEVNMVERILYINRNGKPTK